MTRGPSHPKHAGLGVCKLPGAEARQRPGWGRKDQDCGMQGLRPVPPGCPPSWSFCPQCRPRTGLPDGGSLACPSGPSGLRDSKASQRNLERLHLQARYCEDSVQGSGQWLECRLIFQDLQTHHGARPAPGPQVSTGSPGHRSEDPQLWSSPSTFPRASWTRTRGWGCLPSSRARGPEGTGWETQGPAPIWEAPELESPSRWGP